MTPADAIRSVLVVDDQRAFAESIALVIGTDAGMRCDGVVFSGDEAVARCASDPPEIVVMDVDMPGTDGIEATRRIVEQHPEVSVVILTGAADATVLARAAGAGARGFMLKDAPISDILEAVRTAEASTTMAVDTGAIGQMAARSGQPEGAGLTSRELEVLGLLAEGQQPKQIARELGISLHTCRGYVKNVLAALGAHSALEAVVEAHRRGLVRLG